MGSLKYLSESGVASITYYETTGWRGVMETAGGSPLPTLFPSLPGAIFPLYHMLADIGEFKGGEVVPTVASDLLRVTSLSLRLDDRECVLVANHTPQPQTVLVTDLQPHVAIRVLDETNAIWAMSEPATYRAQVGEQRATADGTVELRLLPLAVVRLDGGQLNGL